MYIFNINGYFSQNLFFLKLYLINILLTCAYRYTYNNNMIKNNKSYEKLECVKNIDEIFDSELFKVLGEPIRCELIKYLAIHGPSDITSISENFPQDRSVISRHLSQMEKLNILNKKKESRRIIYDLNARDFLAKFEYVVDKIKLLLNHCD